MVWNPQHPLLFDFQPMRNGIDQSYKMPTSRCVRLMLISMANDLKEVWISDHPVLMGTYMWQYMPTWALWLTSKLGKKRIQNFKNGLVRAIYTFLYSMYGSCVKIQFSEFLKIFFSDSIPVSWLKYQECRIIFCLHTACLMVYYMISNLED